MDHLPIPEPDANEQPHIPPPPSPRLHRIAVAHRYVLCAIVVRVISWMIPVISIFWLKQDDTLIGLCIAWPIWGLSSTAFATFVSIKTAKAMEDEDLGIAAVLAAIPCLNLFILFAMKNHTEAALAESHIRLEIFGVSDTDIQALGRPKISA